MTRRLCRIHRIELRQDLAGIPCCALCRKDIDATRPDVPAAQKLLRDLEMTQGVQVRQ